MGYSERIALLQSRSFLDTPLIGELNFFASSKTIFECTCLAIFERMLAYMTDDNQKLTINKNFCMRIVHIGIIWVAGLCSAMGCGANGK